MSEPRTASADRRGQPRVALVGPTLPFRGGIAHHTTMLHRALASRCALLTLGFTRQYPRLLFPGESDRDPHRLHHVEAGVQLELDSLDPRTWRRAAGLILQHGASTVVLPWWTVYFAPVWATIARAVRRRGVRVVFLCHNVVDHEASRWKAATAALVLGLGDGFIVHSEQCRARVARLGAKPVTLLEHPTYDHYPAPVGALPRRAALELLFFGFVRPYKGVDVLVEALARARAPARLTIAGEFWGGHAALQARVAALGLGDRVEIVPRYLSDAESSELFGRADVVVLPYRAATGSGVLTLAQHFGRPAIVTNVGGLPAAIEPGVTGFIVPAGDVDALAHAIDAAHVADRGAMEVAIRARALRRSWSSYADAVLQRAVLPGSW